MPVIDLEQLLRATLAHQQELEQEGVLFLGDINDATAEQFSRQLLGLAIKRSQANLETPITVYINSGGGSVGAGLAMMEMIYKARDQYKVTINTVVSGFAYSMGAIVFQAGNTRTMGTFSTLMLHSPQWYVNGNDQIVFNDFARLANHYKSLVANLFACRSGKHTAAWWEDYIYSGRDRFLTAGECVDLGLCDELYGTDLPCPPPVVNDKNRSGLGE